MGNTLKPLSSIELNPDQQTILKWLRSTKWELANDPHDATIHKARVPEFFSGVRLYGSQAGGANTSAQGALEIFIKRLGFSGIINKPSAYPISGNGTNPRYVSLKKSDMDNLGIGKSNEEED